MPPQHGPRRTQVTFSAAVAKQLESITFETELHAVDRVLVVISVSADPEAGAPIPGAISGPQLREYTDVVDQVRVLYFVTALRTVIVVAYIEV